MIFEATGGTTAGAMLSKIVFTMPLSQKARSVVLTSVKGLKNPRSAIREMVSFGLTSQGYRVVAAANGADAIAAFERQRREVRVVLLDTDMPVLDGKATIPLIRALAPATPIVLMSGQVTADSITDPAARLAKPFQLEELLRTITSLLAGR